MGHWRWNRWDGGDERGIPALTTMVKVFIDVLIAIWALVLAWHWERFPTSVLGHIATFGGSCWDFAWRLRRSCRRRRGWRRCEEVGWCSGEGAAGERILGSLPALVPMLGDRSMKGAAPP